MSEIMRWIAAYGKETLQAAGIVGGLFFTAASFRANAKERRISNLMSIAGSHRDLWLQVTRNPELARILRDDVDLESSPITPAEERFVHLLIIHLFVTFEAVQSGALSEIHGLKRDVRDFFSHPIPRKVWSWSRQFQESRFRAFVDGIRFEFQNAAKASRQP
jgi:hypothetical protein